MIEIATTSSPVGPLTLAARAGRVCLLHFGADQDEVRRALARWYGSAPVSAASDPARAITALRAYFAGELSALQSIEVELNGTAFQQRVWAALRHIGVGASCSYRDLAAHISAPSAIRAVGAANAANPIAIIVPCHRVIGANGTLTGYGGGLDRKRWLLQHEAAATRLFAP